MQVPPHGVDSAVEENQIKSFCDNVTTNTSSINLIENIIKAVVSYRLEAPRLTEVYGADKIPSRLVEQYGEHVHARADVETQTTRLC